MSIASMTNFGLAAINLCVGAYKVTSGNLWGIANIAAGLYCVGLGAVCIQK